MLNHLVASAPAKSWSLGGTLSSVVFHGALVLAAVEATVGSGGDGAAILTDTTMVFVQPAEEQKPEETPRLDLAAPAGFNILTAPVVVPTSIPAIDLTEKFDPRD